MPHLSQHPVFLEHYVLHAASWISPRMLPRSPTHHAQLLRKQKGPTEPPFGSNADLPALPFPPVVWTQDIQEIQGTLKTLAVHNALGHWGSACPPSRAANRPGAARAPLGWRSEHVPEDSKLDRLQHRSAYTHTHTQVSIE